MADNSSANGHRDNGATPDPKAVAVRRKKDKEKKDKRKRPDKTPDGRMPVMDHLRELRRRIVFMLLILLVGGIVGWFLYPHVLEILKDPYCGVPEKYRANPNGVGDCVLIYHGALDGLTTRLKVSAITGAIVSGPFWLYQVWAFIVPGLHRRERRYTLWFVAVSSVLFAAGVILAYVVLHTGLRIILEVSGDGVAAQLTVSDYISFVTLMLVMFGAAFELPLLIVMANMAGALPSRFLKKSQRVAIFLIFVFAGVATPTADPFTMCAMAFPMVLLFEAAVLFSHFHDKRKAARKQADREDPHLEDDVASTIDPIPEQLPSWSDTT